MYFIHVKFNSIFGHFLTLFLLLFYFSDVTQIFFHIFFFYLIKWSILINNVFKLTRVSGGPCAILFRLVSLSTPFPHFQDSLSLSLISCLFPNSAPLFTPTLPPSISKTLASFEPSSFWKKPSRRLLLEQDSLLSFPFFPPLQTHQKHSKNVPKTYIFNPKHS